MLSQALVLGLSTGPVCLGTCLPVLFPLICARGSSALRARARALGAFSMGRLAAYLAFGALVGFLGGEVHRPVAARISALGMIVLALQMIAFGLVTGFPRLGLCSRMVRRLPKRGLSPALGFLTGLSLCPPFLMAMSYVFTLGRAGAGLGFFAIYFLATSLWLLPVLLLGRAAAVERVRWVAQFAALGAGLIFLVHGLSLLIATRAMG
jgi:hypothetical protein